MNNQAPQEATPAQVASTTEQSPVVVTNVVNNKSKQPPVWLAILLFLVFFAIGFLVVKVITDGSSLEGYTIKPVEGLEYKETDQYAFYYPKGYRMKTATAPMKYYYESSDKNKLEGYDNINLISDSFGGKVSKSDVDCADLEDSYVTPLKSFFDSYGFDFNVESNKKIASGRYIGCDIISTYGTDDVEGVFVSHVKVLTMDQAEDYYAVTVTYERGTESEAILEKALANFVMK